MKRNLFKVCSMLIILCAMMLCLLCTDNSTKVSAAATKEVESNDTYQTATAISVNTQVTGNLYHKDDKDYYKFTVPSNGYFSLTFGPEVYEEKDAIPNWYTAFYNSTGVNGAVGTHIIHSFYANTKATTTKYGVEAGTYYIGIDKGEYTDYISTNYVFTINFVAANDWETEPNNTYQTADTYTIGTTINGNILHVNDVDYYKFTIPENGIVTVNFKHEIFSYDLNPWYFMILDSTGVNAADGGTSPFAFYSSSDGKMTDLGLKAGTYYAKVYGRSYSYSSKDYQLKIDFTPSSSFEAENNGSKENANTIPFNTSISGRLNYNTDNDWYKFQIQKASKVKFKFKTPDEYEANEIRFYIYDSNKSSVADLEAYYLLRANKTFETKEVTLDSGTYYIYARCENTSSYVLDGIYSFEVIYTCSHSYGTPTKLNDSTHKAACTICGAVQNSSHSWESGSIIEQPDCSKTGSQNQSCDCGATRVVTLSKTNDHKYGSYTSVNAASHSQTCSVCDKVYTQNHRWNSGTVTKDPNCTETGTKQYTCLDCSETKEETLPISHTWGSYTVLDTSEHKRACTLCPVTETNAHSWNSGTVTQKATCKQTGTKLYSCPDCKTEKETTIPLSDEHSYGKFSSDNMNTHTKACSVCEKKITENHAFNSYEYIDESTHQASCSCGQKKVANHEFGEWVVTLEATKSSVGEEQRLCEACGAKETQEIEAIKKSLFEQPFFWVVVVGAVVVIGIIIKKKVYK